MARHVPLALLALVCGCVNLTPPAGVTIVHDADPADVLKHDTIRPDIGESPDAGEESDAGTDGGGDPDSQTEPDGPSMQPDGPTSQPDAPPPPDAPLLLVNGSTCTGGGQCQSGVCTEGVCCDQACGVTCWSCKVTGSFGTCSPTTGATCAAGSCSGSIETAASTCNAAGACVAPSSRSCGAYQCAGTTCGTSCTSGAQCTSGNVCFAGGCVPQGSTPALYWSFDEASGTTATDGSGNALHGTYTGVTSTPQPSTDVPSLMFANPRSRAFNLSNRQGVRLASMPTGLKPANNVTVSLWYKATQVDPDHPNDDASDLLSAGDQYMLRLTDSDVHFVKRTSTTFDKCFGTFTGPLNGQWHHVAATTSTTGMKVFVDGVQRCSNSLGDSVSYTAGDDLWVGRHGNGDTDRDFGGQIDDVRIYTRVLSATEIADLAAGRR
jgi:hypothetical protein